MQKKFITNLAFLLFLNLLVKPFWILGIDRTVQNTVGAEMYGHYYALFNFSFLLNILLDLGITNFNNKNIAQNNHLLTKHLSGIITLRIMLVVFYVLISFFNGFIIGYERDQLFMLLVLLFNQALISFILYLRSNLAGLHLFKTDSIISVLDRLIMIIICSALLWGNFTGTAFKIEWFVYTQSFAYVITTIVALVILLKKSRIKKLTWKPVFSLMILKKSYPYAVLILLMTFYHRIDTVMLERLLPDGSRQAGIYAQAYRLLDAASMIAFLFAGLLLPMFSKMIKQKDRIDELLRLSYCLLVIPAFIVGIVSYFFRFELMDLLYHEHIIESAGIFGLLMICFTAISTSYIYGTLLTANGNLKQLNLMATGGMLLNIVLNIILIPKYNATGAAIASLTTQMLTSVVQAILAYKFFGFRPDYKFILKIALFIGLSVFMVSYIYGTGSGWELRFFTSVITCFVSALLLKLISIKSIYKVMR